MIDWVSMLLPLTHSKPICDGSFLSLRGDGSIEYEGIKRRSVEGSFSTSIQVRTDLSRSVSVGGDVHHRAFGYVEVSGNPVKIFQGHNLWGTNDLPGLVAELAEWLASVLGVVPSERDRQLWAEGAIDVTRVDVTESFHLRSRAEVLAWLRAAEQTAHLAHRGRGQLVKGSTLYFGQHSRRWALKLYSKGQEIEAVDHGQGAILELPHAREWADRTLRAELVLRSLELKRLGLSQVVAWNFDDHVQEGCGAVTSKLLLDRLGSLTMSTTSKLDDAVFESLTNAQRTAYLSWLAGHDLRQVMSIRSFYRLRAKLLPHGVDIATLIPKETSNVVPLVRVLEAVPAPVPDWAIGTALYFEPRRLRAVA